MLIYMMLQEYKQAYLVIQKCYKTSGAIEDSWFAYTILFSNYEA